MQRVLPPEGWRQVRITWAKDDNPRYQRLRGELLTVSFKDETTIMTGHGWEWSKDEVIEWEDNQLDTGRGYAHLYQP